MTIQEERTYVEAAWEHPALQSLEKAGFNKNGSMTKLGMIHAAYLFTVELQRQIAEVEEEIELLSTEAVISPKLEELYRENTLEFSKEFLRRKQVMNRILAREQQRLADLRKGVK
jgi:hypothetical protein